MNSKYAKQIGFIYAIIILIFLGGIHLPVLFKAPPFWQLPNLVNKDSMNKAGIVTYGVLLLPLVYCFFRLNEFSLSRKDLPLVVFVFKHLLAIYSIYTFISYFSGNVCDCLIELPQGGCKCFDRVGGYSYTPDKCKEIQQKYIVVSTGLPLYFAFIFLLAFFPRKDKIHVPV